MSEHADVPAVIAFDAVGTLILPDPPAADAYLRIGREHGSQLSLATIQSRFRTALREDREPRLGSDSLKSSDLLERRRWQRIVAFVFREIPNASSSLFDTLWEYFAQPQHWRLNLDVAECWHAVEQAGWTIGIASNFDRRLETIAAALDPLNRARFVTHSARLQVRKPAAEFYLKLQRELGQPAHRFVMVGDDWEADILGARKAGWHAVWLNPRRTTDAELGRTNVLSATAKFQRTTQHGPLECWFEIERLAQLPECIGLVRKARSH